VKRILSGAKCENGQSTHEAFDSWSATRIMSTVDANIFPAAEVEVPGMYAYPPLRWAHYKPH